MIDAHILPFLLPAARTPDAADAADDDDGEDGAIHE